VKSRKRKRSSLKSLSKSMKVETNNTIILVARIDTLVCKIKVVVVVDPRAPEIKMSVDLDQDKDIIIPRIMMTLMMRSL